MTMVYREGVWEFGALGGNNVVRIAELQQRLAARGITEHVDGAAVWAPALPADHGLVQRPWH